MTDPAGITQRGAERSAPRSRSGPSSPDSHGIARPWTRFVATRATEDTARVFHGDPPDAGLEIKRRAPIANGSALDLLPSRQRGAVQRRAPTRGRVGVTASGIGCVSTELISQRGGAAALAVARLTSASGDRDPAHESIVVAGVPRCSSVAPGQRPGVAVEGISRALKLGIQ